MCVMRLVYVVATNVRALCSQPDESLRFDDQAAERMRPVGLAHQPKTKIGRWHAGRAAAGARITHKIGHVGTVTPFDDAHAAMHSAIHRIALRVERASGETR